jgi:hypothetical protein
VSEPRGAALAAILAVTACSGGLDLAGGEDATNFDGDSTDLAALCRPMDARPPGGYACAIEIGVKWDGRHCVNVGSGCECFGADCGSLFLTLEDCVTARRACYPEIGCGPQMVVGSAGCVDEFYLGAAWNGRACVELLGCACEGDGCTTLFDSLGECEAYLAGCGGAP